MIADVYTLHIHDNSESMRHKVNIGHQIVITYIKYIIESSMCVGFEHIICCLKTSNYFK